MYAHTRTIAINEDETERVDCPGSGQPTEVGIFDHFLAVVCTSCERSAMQIMEDGDIL